MKETKNFNITCYIEDEADANEFVITIYRSNNYERTLNPWVVIDGIRYVRQETK